MVACRMMDLNPTKALKFMVVDVELTQQYMPCRRHVEIVHFHSDEPTNEERTRHGQGQFASHQESLH